MDVRIQVAERQNLEMLDERVDARHARQQRRHDDDRAGGLGNTVREVEALQAFRRNQPRCQTLDAADRHVRRWNRQQQGDDRLHRQ